MYGIKLLCNSSRFIPNILPHSGNRGTADEKGCTLNTEKGIVVHLTEPFFARILAHLSEDSLLISTLHTAEDVFISLAARYNAWSVWCHSFWNGIPFYEFFTRVADTDPDPEGWNYIIVINENSSKFILFNFFYKINTRLRRYKNFVAKCGHLRLRLRIRIQDLDPKTLEMLDLL